MPSKPRGERLSHAARVSILSCHDERFEIIFCRDAFESRASRLHQLLRNHQHVHLAITSRYSPPNRSPTYNIESFTPSSTLDCAFINLFELFTDVDDPDVTRVCRLMAQELWYRRKLDPDTEDLLVAASRTSACHRGKLCKISVLTSLSQYDKGSQIYWSGCWIRIDLRCPRSPSPRRLIHPMSYVIVQTDQYTPHLLNDM